MVLKRTKGLKRLTAERPTSRETKSLHTRLLQALHYDKKTGQFTWKVHRGRVTKGTPANSPQSMGYIEIGFEGENYLAHRLAWFYVYGKWPEHTIDHIDGNKTNNAIKNLRDVTHEVNMYNRSNSLGVAYSKGKWNAEIMRRGKHIYLGRYKTFKEARAAYLAARKEFS